MKARTRITWRLLVGSLLVLTLFDFVVWAAPSSVTLVGSLQDELGCSGDWQPDCAATHLTEFGNGVWRGEFTIPAGSWEYKNVLNDTWDESYPSSNKGLNVGAATGVRFYYDDKTKAVVDSVNDAIPVAVGNFQAAIGCTGDWQPSCVNSLLTDVDNDGVYSFVTDAIPPGAYEFKVAMDEDWVVTYPGGNVPFVVPANGDQVTITWDSATTDVTVSLSLIFIDDFESGGTDKWSKVVN